MITNMWKFIMTQIALIVLLLAQSSTGRFHGNLVHPHKVHAFEAKWHGNLIAAARVEDVLNVNGQYFFPNQAINREFFRPSDTVEKQKFGKANFYSLHEAHPIHGTHVKIEKDAASVFLNPKKEYEYVKGRVTFHKGVVIDHVEVDENFLRHHDQFPDSQIVGKSMDSVDIVTDDETIKTDL